jgi:hypothetical protein
MHLFELMHDNTDNHSSALGMIECIVHELVRVRIGRFHFDHIH